MNLVVLEAADLESGGTAHMTGARARHLIRVLGVTPGRKVRVGLLDGALGTGEVLRVERETVTLRCSFADTPPRPEVDLLLALPRPKVLRRLWAQLAAIGVGQIILTNAERVERNYFDTHLLDPGNYRPLLIEGLQQARDTHLPDVSVHRQFRVLIEDRLDALVSGATRLAAHPGAVQSVRAGVERGPHARVLLAVGPEGGWNQFELDMLRAHGFSTVGFGPRTLRIDTACVALLTLAHDAMRRAAAATG